ncbi:hypothetical protein GCM10018966_040570 [Streptomyces yanii]
MPSALASEEASSPPQAVRTVDTARARAVPGRALVRIDLFIGVFLSAPLGGGKWCMTVPVRSPGVRLGVEGGQSPLVPAVRPSVMAVVLARIIRR